MDYIIEKKGRIGFITPIPQHNLAVTLSKNMQYIKQGAQFMPNPNWAIVRMYKDKTGKFPWGMIKIVENVFNKWCKNNNVDSFQIIADYEKEVTIDPDKLNKMSPMLREYQKDAILQLIINHGGIVSLPTGAGKTFMAVEYIKYIDKKTLVVVHTIDLKIQWKEQVPNYVDVMTYQSIKFDNILKDYGLVIFDEVHHVASKSLYTIAMKCHNAIICGLSATPERTDGEDMKINAAVGEIVYNIDKRTLIEQGFLSDAKVHYIELKNHNKERFLNYQEMYQEMIVDNEERNDKIIDIIKKNKDKHKILVLVSYVEHGNKLKALLADKNIDSLYLHGKIKNRTIPDDANLIIATSIFDEGKDLPSFDILILAAGGKSSIKLTQRVGRVLRTHPEKKHAIIYDFEDKSRYLSVHYKNRRDILEEDFIIEK